MADLSRENKVGLTVLAALLCLGGLVVFLGRIHFNAPGYPLHVDFNYVDSLKADAPVLYGGGVKIGTVDGLAVVDGKVQVSLHILKAVKIPKNSVFTIHTSGILGEKYVQVSAGDVALGPLEGGARIEGMDPGSLDRTLQRIEGLTEFLEPLLQDPKFKNSFAATMGNLNQMSAELNRMVTKASPDIQASVHNLRVLSDTLRGRIDDIKSIIDSAKGVLNEQNRKNLEKSLVSLESTLNKVDKVMTQVDQKKGTLGAIVYDEKLSQDIRDILIDLKRHPWKLLWKK